MVDYKFRFKVMLSDLGQFIRLNMWVMITFILLLLFYLHSCFYESQTYFALTISGLIPPNCFWIIFTFSFYNTHIIKLIFDCVTVYMIDIVMFPSWKLSEVIRFCVVVQLTSALLVVFGLIICYALTFDVHFLSATYIYGLSPLLGGALVTIRQLTPNNVLTNLPLGKFRTKHIVFTAVLIVLGFSILKVTDYVHFALIWYGVLVSWVYLRFYQRHSNGDIGDTTDAFKFSGFFPNHLEPPISIASNAIFNLLVYLKICKNRASLVLDWSKDFSVIVESDDADGKRKNLAEDEVLQKMNCFSPSLESSPCVLPKQPV